MREPIAWEDLWMRTAELVGQRSKCSRAQYGAVIVSEDNRVLSVGYNGPPAGLEVTGSCDQWCTRAMNALACGNDSVDPNYLDCHAVHAESNAIMRANNLWLEKSPTLYVNGVTCQRCALTIANSGVKNVVMLVNEFEQKRDPSGTAELLKKYLIGVRLKTWR